MIILQFKILFGKEDTILKSGEYHKTSDFPFLNKIFL